MSRKTTTALLIAVVTAGTALACTANERTGTKQRVQIEVTIRLPLSSGPTTGTFILDPLTPGPLEIDRGTFRSVGGNLGEGSRGIQRHRPFRYTDTFTGRAGTLVVRQDARLVSVGGGYEIGTGTWKVVRGTGYYQGVTGEGLGFAVLAHPEWEGHPNGAAIHARYEGYLTTPDVPTD